MEIRCLEPGDAVLWRDIRLEALRLEPAQFASRHEDWVDRPLADFAARLQTAPVWAVIDAGRALAVASLSPDAEAPARGWLEAVYVRPEVRGRGYARRVVAAVEAAARVRGLRELCLEVRQANAAARGLYAQLGFAPRGCGGRSPGSGCELTMVKVL